MPCYDERNSPAYVEAETAARVRQECRHNSDVAELLCWVLTQMGDNHADRYTPAHFREVLLTSPRLSKWWSEHQERDRKKAQAKRRAEHNRKIDEQIEALRKQKR